jgi:hypothetical protein
MLSPWLLVCGRIVKHRPTAISQKVWSMVMAVNRGMESIEEDSRGSRSVKTGSVSKTILETLEDWEKVEEISILLFFVEVLNYTS